jgi:hypothetical protein
MAVLIRMVLVADDFMLCKQESADPAHCLKEGRRVTRCAGDLIEKMRASCAQTYDSHWQCLENNNQVRPESCSVQWADIDVHHVGILQVQEARAQAQRVHL